MVVGCPFTNGDKALRLLIEAPEAMIPPSARARPPHSADSKTAIASASTSPSAAASGSGSGSGSGAGSAKQQAKLPAPSPEYLQQTLAAVQAQNLTVQAAADRLLRPAGMKHTASA
jgi:hypothetical protein